MVVYLLLSFVVTRLNDIPRSSVIMAWMILILFMAGSRIAYRLSREGRLFLARPALKADQIPILIVGGGIDVEIFLRSLDAAAHYYPVGIIDSNGGAALRGVPVLGSLGDIERVILSYEDAGDRPQKIAIVGRGLARDVLDQLVDIANRLGLGIARAPDPARLKPGVRDTELLEPISVQDLLGRPQIVLDQKPIQELITNKRVLITGAGGSIGSEIVRQVCQIGPSALCLLDSAEFNLYNIDKEVHETWPSLVCASRLIDVRRRRSIQDCFRSFRPDIVFHAAALKHVPLVEANPIEGIWTNTIGSRNVCDAAAAVRCKALVLISTDKAVNPTNIMGASKRGAECYAQALARPAEAGSAITRFIGVRFGNVLGSTGSVVPLFESQLARGRPLTVTHPEIERFFMTIREAVELVLQAAALGACADEMQGRMFVLDMGKPVRIAELAKQMIRLKGLRPEIDVPIIYTGLRAGEKLYEELSANDEELRPTVIPRLNVVASHSYDIEVLRDIFCKIEAACAEGITETAIGLLSSVVPEYSGDQPAEPGETPRVVAPGSAAP
jgi:O-antigen biosynthesis protein WbqV